MLGTGGGGTAGCRDDDAGETVEGEGFSGGTVAPRGGEQQEGEELSDHRAGSTHKRHDSLVKEGRNWAENRGLLGQGTVTWETGPAEIIPVDRMKSPKELKAGGEDAEGLSVLSDLKSPAESGAIDLPITAEDCCHWKSGGRL